MIDLDLKDRKILYQLLLDSRQSLKSIGKKTGLSKESVYYRIKRLLKNKVITNFRINIKWHKLGYSCMVTFYKFININPSIKNEILDFFVNNKNTMYVSLLEGSNDLQVDFWLGEPFEFESLIDEIQERFYKYLSFQSSKFYIRAEYYNFCFLLNETINTSEPFQWGWGEGIEKIDETDFKILKELSKDSRISTVELANKINSTVSSVNYRIKKLIQKDIIFSYTVNIDWSKIGYRWFHLQIKLWDYSKKDKIVTHLRKNPNLIRYLKHLIIGVDLHFTFLLHNMEELRKIIEDITTKFPDSINDYSFYSTYKVYKFDFMTPKLLKNRNPIYQEY